MDRCALSTEDRIVLDRWAAAANRPWAPVAWSLLVGEDGAPGVLFHAAAGPDGLLGSVRRLPDGCWGASTGQAVELSARADSLRALMTQAPCWLWRPAPEMRRAA